MCARRAHSIVCVRACLIGAVLGIAVAASAADKPAAPAVAASAVSATHPGTSNAFDMLDPLEVVRARLAARLGSIRAPDTPNSNVLRVSGKSDPNSQDGLATMTLASGTTVQRAHRNARTAGHVEAASGSGHWDYAGADGPERWARLNPEFAACATGTRQSPIDIRDGIKVDLDPVQIDYQPSAFKVIDNGHTVQVDVAPGNWIEVMGGRYELVQFHFHRPSEERIAGKQFDMVVHMVHKDASGRLAVIAVLLESGAAQPIVQRVWNNLPLEKGSALAARGTIDLGDLLPADRAYFTYMGSLTTPPCSEGVLWMVMKNPVPVSAEQIGVFARLYPMNARPVQSAQGRMIKESN